MDEPGIHFQRARFLFCSSTEKIGYVFYNQRTETILPIHSKCFQKVFALD